MFLQFFKNIFTTIKVPTGEETNAVVKLDLPPGFREYEEYTFPLIMYMYVCFFIQILLKPASIQ